MQALCHVLQSHRSFPGLRMNCHRPHKWTALRCSWPLLEWFCLVTVPWSMFARYVHCRHAPRGFHAGRAVESGSLATFQAIQSRK